MPERTTPTSPTGTRSGSSAAVREGRKAGPGASASSAATDGRLQPAVDAIASGSCSVLSLDIFDTLLWRKVPEPTDAFLVLGSRLRDEGFLAPDVDAGAFAVLRALAEQRARREREGHGRGVEVTLREICAGIAPATLQGITLDELIAYEVELERSLLVPDLDIVELARSATEAGIRVVCVSDTYFSEADLRTFVGIPPAGALEIDRVFASSAHRVGKGDGLWRIVLEQLGVAGKEVVHVGDNFQSDVLAAGRAQVRGVYFERRPEGLGRIVSREELHAIGPLSSYHGDYGLTALRSKVLHRTEGHNQPSELRPFWEHGAASLGPPLTGFAEWVQERAGQAGASKVFCMMREGELLSRLVNSARALVDFPAEAEPIWLSRQVCARASIIDGNADELGRLFHRRRMPRVGEFCATLGVDSDEVPGFERRADSPLHEPDLAHQLVERLVFDPELRARIVAHSAELRGRVVRYVESVRPPGEERLMLVDLGWGATIQYLLDGLLREEGSDVRTAGLYLITTDRAADRMLDGTEVHGFLANAGQPEGPVDAFMRSPELLEQICMPDHGSQVGLDKNLQPVLEDAEPLPLQAAQREATQKGIAAFEREWLRYRTSAPYSMVPLHNFGQDRLRAILVRAMTAPTLDEASLFAGWLHDENFGSTGLDALVPPTSARAARYLEPHVLLESSMAELYWPFGLAALHDEHLAKAVEAAAAGVVHWEGLSSPLETGDVEIFCDRGWGFRRQGSVSVSARRNRLGLSYVNGTLVGDIIRRVRLDLAKSPCLLRVDWIRLRCHQVGGTEPRVLDYEAPGDFKRASRSGMRPIGPNAFVVSGTDPHLVIDLDDLPGGDVHTVSVECGFAVVPLAASGLTRRLGIARTRLKERAKRGRLGAPVRFAYRLVRKVD